MYARLAKTLGKLENFTAKARFPIDFSRRSKKKKKTCVSEGSLSDRRGGRRRRWRAGGGGGGCCRVSSRRSSSRHGTRRPSPRRQGPPGSKSRHGTPSSTRCPPWQTSLLASTHRFCPKPDGCRSPCRTSSSSRPAAPRTARPSTSASPGATRCVMIALLFLKYRIGLDAVSTLT